MRRLSPLLLILLFALCLPFSAHAEEPAFLTVPDVLRPGKYYDIAMSAPYAGSATLVLVDSAGEALCTVFSGYPMAEGRNVFSWDGLSPDRTVPEQGDYTFRLTMDNGAAVESQVRIGAPYPLLTGVMQSDSVLPEDAALDISFTCSQAGSLLVELRYPDGTVSQLSSLSISQGEGTFQWRGNIAGARVPAGRYALILTLKSSGGMQSISQHVMVDVEPTAEAAAAAVFSNTTPAPTDVPLPTQEPLPTPTPAPLLSPPYSAVADDTFWSMTPGELSDEEIWRILMQPITVYDGGLDAKPKVHAYMMENPDGTGEKIAQLHAQSQGLHVIGETNEHGYVLVEAFSNYDENYNPKTDEEKAHAFDMKQGYVKAKDLKTVNVATDMALLIDKLSQRMYLFVDGVRVTEFLIATGLIADGKYYNETIAGEYITISRTGGFPSGNMYCDMAIRINGGILIHEVPYKTNRDGTKNYSSFEGYLGTKQSHGCIRVQRLKNAEGYNHRWLWDNLIKGPYKVIIWDDLNRVDTPTTWQPNPKN